MADLGRVNLLVGTNNCGKTSVLEAINILSDFGSPMALWKTMVRRGETRDDTEEAEVDLSHIFHGHQLAPGASFVIAGQNATSGSRLEARISERDPSEKSTPSLRRSRQAELGFARPEDESGGLGSMALGLNWSMNSAPYNLKIPLTRRGGLAGEYISTSRSDDVPMVSFVTTESLTRTQVVQLLEDAVLTSDEDTVLAALHTIEPAIERIAPVGSTTRRRFGGFDRGGIAVKLGGQRVPIGSLGDGIWRLLGIALSLVKAKNGVLLVDEIDTGLHYSVLSDLWRLVYETATRLDVQVFATTHSRDCFESLAAISHAEGSDVTIQRIERGRTLAVALSEPEIREAARRGIEVR
jgi:AAA domain, putative AbiEii toxin, Type IV TA system